MTVLELLRHRFDWEIAPGVPADEVAEGDHEARPEAA